MDSDQVFDHRKFDSGALQGGTAPTDTPSKSVYFQRVAEDLKLDTRDPFTHIFAKTCALMDQRNDLLRELAAALAEVKRLNEWADGMTDAALKERQTGEMYQRELRAEIERLRQQQDELARQVGLEVWHIGATLRRPDMRPIIARVRAEMEKEKKDA